MIRSNIVKLFRGLRSARKPFNRRAGVALAVGLAAPILIGATGFGVDAAFWIAQHTTLQTATDAAAIKAVRDLQSNPSLSFATVQADALAAANHAVSGQMTLTSDELTIAPAPTDSRQIIASATIPGARFFSQLIYPLPVNIGASSTAAVAYPLVSTQATCYMADSYSYIYSTGFGTIDTAHSSGLDPYSCGSPPSPPTPYDAYCGGGVLGCSLDVLNAGNILLPFAFQVGPNGGSGGLNVVLAPVVNTLAALLGGAQNGNPGSMTFVGPGTSFCSGTSCTVPAGLYDGGLTIEPGVTVNFGSGLFLIENGNLVISTQDTVPANSAVFYLGGTNPGGFVEATQVAVNTAPLDTGSILLSSSSTFKTSSLIGTQTSSPLSSAGYAQQQAYSQGLLSLAGLPGQNLVGTNFISVVSICPGASSTCSNPQDQNAAFESTLIPSIAPVAQLLPGLQPIQLLANEGLTSTTTINSGVNYDNGVAVNWSQSETQSSTLTNTLQTIPAVVKSVTGDTGLALTLLSVAVTPVLQPILNAIAPNETNSQSTSDSGTFANQTSLGTPSCASQPILYSNSITPSYGPGFSDILQVAGQNGANGALSVSDTITICGTTPQGISSISPLSPGASLVSSTASGASAIYLTH